MLIEEDIDWDKVVWSLVVKMNFLQKVEYFMGVETWETNRRDSRNDPLHGQISRVERAGSMAAVGQWRIPIALPAFAPPIPVLPLFPGIACSTRSTTPPYFGTRFETNEHYWDREPNLCIQAHPSGCRRSLIRVAMLKKNVLKKFN